MSIRKINESVKNLDFALTKLRESLDCNKNDKIAIDASIYRFQVVNRLLWKTLKRALEFEGYILDTPREILKLCFSIDWIENEEIWLEILELNHLIVVAYTDEDLAFSIHEKINMSFDEMNKLLIRTKEKYNKNYAQHAI